MAVGRMINRTAGLDQELNSVSIEAHLLFVMSIPHLDRDGLIIGEPLPHLGTVLPLRPDFFQKYEQLLSELTDCGIVIRYATKKGRVLYFPGFRKNQTFAYHREGASVFDPPPGYVRTATGLTQDNGVSNALPTQELVGSNSGVTQDQNTLKISKDKVREDKATPDLLSENEAQDAMVSQWESVLGATLTPAIFPEVKQYMDKLQARGVVEWWLLALKETTGAKRPGWPYMKAVLESWLAAGTPSVAKNGTDPAKKTATGTFRQPSPDGTQWIHTDMATGKEVKREPRSEEEAMF